VKNKSAASSIYNLNILTSIQETADSNVTSQYLIN